MVADLLATRLLEARAEYPTVRLDDATFAAFVVARLSEESLSAACTTDLFLSCACLGGDAAALGELLQRHGPTIRRELARVRGSGADPEDVYQAFVCELVLPTEEREPKLAQYRGEGGLAAFIRVCATRFALNAVRGKRRQGTVDVEAVLAERMAADNPELEVLDARYRGAVHTALVESFRALTAEEKSLLRFYYVDGLDFGAIAKLVRVHRTTIGRHVHELAERLLADTRRRLGLVLDAGEDSVDSIIRTLRSRLVVDLRELL